MILMQVTKLCKSYANRMILDGVTFDVNEGQHVALVGTNGSGKSTLLKLIAGEVQPDSGKILFPGGDSPQFGYLPQYAEAVSNTQTTWEYALEAFHDCRRIEANLRALEAQLAAVKGRRLEQLLGQYGQLQERFSRLGGYDCEARLRAALQQVGVPDRLLSQPLQSLSGGEKTRVGLARLLARNSQFLLLDEPTNHIDIDTIEWLEGFLLAFTGTILVVSHERRFLDVVADTVLELRQGSIRAYPGNYTAYRQLKEAEEQRQWEEWQQSEKKRRALEEAIRRQAEWAQRAHSAAGKNDFLRRRAKKVALRARARVSQLRRLLDDQPVRPVAESTIHFAFAPPERTGHRIVEASAVSLAYGPTPLFQDLSFTIQKGDNVAIIGPNGAGKTSLLRLITGEVQPSSGDLWVTTAARVGYLPQELAEVRPEERVLDELRSVTSLSVREARNLLGTVLLRGDDVFRPLRTLSQGERVRLELAKLLARGADVLLLDEPTNHLDLDSRETVEEALSLFEGTVILVSHDRYLLERFADRLIVLDPPGARMHEVTYSEYGERRKLQRWALEHRGELGWQDLVALHDETLRLENQLATLGAELSRSGEEEAQDQVQREYRTTSARLAELRRLLSSIE